MNAALLKDIGYLILRLGIGGILARHGWPKIIGGPKDWEDLGGVVKDLFGISLFPVFWGLCAAIAEFAGGICIAIGFLFRPACILVLITMCMAFGIQIHNGDSFGDWAESAELAIAALSMLLMNAGRFSLSVSLNK